MKSKRLTPVPAAGAALLVTVLQFSAAAQGLIVDTASREAVRVFYNQVYTASEGKAPNWNGNIATCTPGTVSQAYQDATVLRVNYFRSMSGLPAAITFTAAGNAKAQASSLMMGANKKIDHHPTASWTCYTELGREGAAGNLAQGNAGPKAIDAWIEDSGSNNRLVGHRRWIIDAAQLTMGGGHVPVGDNDVINSTLWVGDTRATPRPATREAFVAWPPKGFVPYHVAFARWSFQLPGGDFSAATVIMQRAGQNVPVDIQERGPFVEPGIVWIPDNLADNARWKRPAADEVYTVNIGNVIVGGTPRSYTYNVTVMDPDADGPDTVRAVVTGPDQPPLNQNSTYNFNAVPGASGYQWRASKLTALSLTDGAENGMVNFDAVTGPYNGLSNAIKASGTKGYRLHREPFLAPQNLTLKRTLFAGLNSQITFKSRFTLGDSYTATVQVSDNGGVSWQNAFSQAGTPEREADFSDKAVSLRAFAGREIRVRFHLVPGAGSAYVGDEVGWFFDDITFVNLQEVTLPQTLSGTITGTSFTFNPTEQAEFSLDVRPQVFGTFFGEWGPAKKVSTIQAVAGTVPAITAQPENKVVPEGSNLVFTVKAASATPMTYQWKREGVNLADSADVIGSTTANLRLPSAKAAQAGNYTVVVSNGTGPSPSAAAKLTVNPPATVQQAVEQPASTPVVNDSIVPYTIRGAELNYVSASGARSARGNTGGTTEPLISHDGEDSLRSGAISHNASTTFRMTATGPATVAFWWRVDSEEHHDFFEFQIDGVTQFAISGLVEWQERMAALPAGQHELRWIYRKDGSVSCGADAGWIDQVSIGDDNDEPTLAEATDSTGITWFSTGSLPWFASDELTHDGVSAARSGPIGGNEESRMEAIITGPADLSFWWETDAESFDSLSFEMDGQFLFEKTQSVLDGDTAVELDDGWERKTVYIPAGTHRVSWVYSKDDTETAGLDAAYVDEVTLTRRTPGVAGEPGPRIDYSVSGSKLRLTWPAAASAWKLQSSATLTNWLDFPGSIRSVEGENSVTVETSAAPKWFYRLAPKP